MDDDGSVGKKMIVIKLANDITNKLPDHIKEKLTDLSEVQRIKLLKTQNEINLGYLVPNILKFDKEIFEILGFKPNESKLTGCYFVENNNIHVAWEFYITGRRDLSMFLNNIKLKLSYKNERIIKLISNIKRKIRKKYNYIPFLLMVREIQNERGFVTNNLIALEHNLNKKYIEKLKLECKKRSLIEEVGKEGPIVKYVLTEVGKNILFKGQ